MSAIQRQASLKSPHVFVFVQPSAYGVCESKLASASGCVCSAGVTLLTDDDVCKASHGVFTRQAGQELLQNLESFVRVQSICKQLQLRLSQ